MNTINTAISQNLKNLRIQFALTHEDVAKAINVKRNRYEAWENRAIPPPIEKLAAIGKLYGVTVDELVYSDNPIPNAQISMEQKLQTAPEHIRNAVISLLRL